jgi:predicted MPP superfamily phosphohydrolase
LKHSKKRMLPWIALAAVAGYSFLIEPKRLSTYHMTIGTKAEGKRHVRLAFFSDTHFGSSFPAEKMGEIADKIMLEKPDIIAFGGDLIDCLYGDCPDTKLLSKHLSNLTAPYGKFAVYGNHDCGGGARKAFPSILEEGGFTLLRNSSVLIEELGVCITGMDDFLMGEPDPEAAERAYRADLHILLAHAPDLADTINLRSVDVMFSGHTHGSQINLPFLKQLILPQGGKKYVKGLYEVGEKGRTSLVVSSGVGTTRVNARLLSPPELIVADLYY